VVNGKRQRVKTTKEENILIKIKILRNLLFNKNITRLLPEKIIIT